MGWSMPAKVAKMTQAGQIKKFFAEPVTCKTTESRNAEEITAK